MTTLNITDLVVWISVSTPTPVDTCSGADPRENPEALNTVQTHFIKPALSSFNTCLIALPG